jgi:hypothetical protein
MVYFVGGPPRFKLGLMKPLAIDLYCGLGGWAEGFLSEGYDVVGFDIERHDYGTGGYPGQLVLQDVLTLSGKQFSRAAVIVASPPCQAYSRRAMPFGGLWLEHNRMDDDGGPPGNYRGKDPIFNDLFNACFRIAAEAGSPIIVENVKGAQKFVGLARWHYRSFYLWGDVPLLMPIPTRYRSDGIKFGGVWWNDSTNNLIRKASSRSIARKAASAQIAKIPFPLAQHIARVFKP